jgi:hypothetical protein
MRQPLDRERVLRFMRALGAEAESEARLYFTGGATAMLLGWRSSTTDLDIKLEPESDRLLRLRLRFAEIEPQLYRYPAIDPAAFRRAVERTAAP